MNEPIETFEHEGITVELHYDMYPENPYKDFDHASEILSDVKDYDLGGDVPHPESWHRETPSSAVMARYLTMFDDYALAIPWRFQDYGSGGSRIYLFEPDEDAADGWLVLTREQYEKEMRDLAGDDFPLHDNGEEFSAEKTIRAEFNEFKAYIEGNVFGWIAAPGSDDEESCWGYYGDLDYVREEAKAAAGYIAHERYVNTEPPDMAEVMAGMHSKRNL